MSCSNLTSSPTQIEFQLKKSEPSSLPSIENDCSIFGHFSLSRMAHLIRYKKNWPQ